MRPPREFSLGFGTIKASFRRCSDLLPEVSSVFDRTEAILGDIFPTHASFSEVSQEMPPPHEFSLGFGTINASFWRCIKLLPAVSPVFCAIPHEFSRGLVIAELSHRPIVCCCFCNSFDAHAI